MSATPAPRPTRTSATFASPIVESRRWLDAAVLPEDLPLLNLSQAAPAAPPPKPLREALAAAVMEDSSAHLYGAVLGRAGLRQALAEQNSLHYLAKIPADTVAITSGCNQAFAATIASLCDEGDEVILPTPWYFNHKMWLDMQGVTAVPLAVGGGMLPDPATAEALMTDKTRAIVLVTPNNPCGTEYPSALLEQFFDLAKSHGIALLVDETYRDFHSHPGAPHNLFSRPDWQDTLVHLYSFSKAYRLTGHRVGALVTAPDRLEEIEKFLDTVTICPSQVGQIGAEWGIRNLGSWLAKERDEILSRRYLIESLFPKLTAQGWKLLGVGAYFAYVQHPFTHHSDALARRILSECGVLMLPGSMFTPANDPDGARQFRIAFANVDEEGIRALFDRLAAFAP